MKRNRLTVVSASLLGALWLALGIWGTTTGSVPFTVGGGTLGVGLLILALVLRRRDRTPGG